jgi:hypothetical protein
VVLEPLGAAVVSEPLGAAVVSEPLGAAVVSEPLGAAVVSEPLGAAVVSLGGAVGLVGDGTQGCLFVHSLTCVIFNLMSTSTPSLLISYMPPPDK